MKQRMGVSGSDSRCWPSKNRTLDVESVRGKAKAGAGCIVDLASPSMEWPLLAPTVLRKVVVVGEIEEDRRLR